MGKHEVQDSFVTGEDPDPADARKAAAVLIGYGVDHGGTRQQYRDVAEMLGVAKYICHPHRVR